MEIPVSQFLGKKFPDGIFRKKHFTTHLPQKFSKHFLLIFRPFCPNTTWPNPSTFGFFVKILFEKHQKMVIFGQKFGHWPNTKSCVCPQKMPKYLAFLALWSKTKVFFY